MKKYIYVLLVVLILGIMGVGCAPSSDIATTYNFKALRDRLDKVEYDLSQVRERGQANTRWSLEKGNLIGTRETRQIVAENVSLESVEITLWYKDLGYGAQSQFSDINEAIKYLETFR